MLAWIRLFTGKTVKPEFSCSFKGLKVAPKHKTRAEYMRWWRRERQTEEAREAERERVRARKKVVREWYREYKASLKCTECGECRPECLDFHHENVKEKKFSVAGMQSKGFTIERIKEEIEKCIVLCCNCHRAHHARERQND